MKLPFPNKSKLFFWGTLIGLAVLLSGFAVVSFFRIKNEARQSLAAERNVRQNDLPFTKTVRSPLDNKHLQIWQNTSDVRAVAHFQDSVFAATSGGLLQFSADGKLLRHWTVLDGLTESDLTALAVFSERLFIGTNSTGLLTFDGAQFENYVWPNQTVKSINALLPDNGRLLIGTFAKGLIEFDGVRFSEIKADGQSLAAVNFLASANQKLFVGTFDDGLWIKTAGRWQHLTTADGLPANRIVGAAVSGNTLYVGTDLGIAETDNIENGVGKIFRPVAILPELSSLVKNQNEILAIKDDGQVFALTGDGKKTKTLTPIAISDLPSDSTNAKLITLADECWLVNSQGIFRRSRNSFATFGNSPDENQLASNTISALAVDAAGRVWAGHFRRGIDVFDDANRKIKHFETESLREINFIRSAKETVWVGTSGGATHFDKSFQSTNFTRSDGLLSNSVMQISVGDDEKNKQFFATGRGLSWRTAATNDWRGLTTINGLPNNNIYTTLFYEDSLFVGTLGGLAELQDGRVIRTVTDANSALTHNWVTALCAGDGRFFIGTYGGGVFELTGSGELRSFSSETGKLMINPNAMLADDNRIYAGTLDGAWMLDLKTQKWTHLTAELPSPTILSITGDRENIYFGTTAGIAKINKKYFTIENNAN